MDIKEMYSVLSNNTYMPCVGYGTWQLSEQEAIFEANKSKIFGAGAKAKKEAKQQIESYKNQIEMLKSKYISKKSVYQAELQRV